MATAIAPPNPQFQELNGDPLDEGYIYIGTANLTAEDNPINVYWDSLLTIPASQPIRTIGGRPDRNGAIGKLYINTDYSMTIKDKKGRLVYSGSSENPADPFESFYIIVETLSELVNLTGYEVDDVVKMTGRLAEGDGGGGEFIWVTGDQSANITADPQQGVYVAPVGDPTGLNGAWKRLIDSAVDVAWWGVVSGGAVDQLEGLRGAYTYADDNGLPVRNLEDFVYIETAGSASRIVLNKVPTTLNMLRLRWNAASGSSNTIFWIKCTENLTAISTVTGSPAFVEQQRTFTISTGLSLAAGDWILYLAGEDPGDANQRHVSQVTRVVSYDSGSGAIVFADGPFADVNYGASFTDVVFYKLDHNPEGGNFKGISLDCSPTVSNQTQSMFIHYCRGFTIGCIEELEQDYGVAIADGCQDWVITTYQGVHTSLQGGLHNPRHLFGPYACLRGTVERFRGSSTFDASTALAIQAEVNVKDLRIRDFEIDIELATAPSSPVFKTTGGSEIFVDLAVIRSNQIVRLHTETNVLGDELFQCQDLHILDAGVEFDVSTTLGVVFDASGYFFGPLELFDFTIVHDGTTNSQVFPLENFIASRVWIKSSKLTTTTVVNYRCTDDTAVVEAINKTANDVWVETVLSDTYVYWDAQTGSKKLNRLDLTAKELSINMNDAAGATYYFRVLGRKVNADQF